MSECIESVRLDDITVDPGLQPRVRGIDSDHLADMVERLADDPEFDLPPVRLFRIPCCDHENEGEHFLSRGFHRVRAYTDAGRETIPAVVKHGTREDAHIDALASNASHGLKRSREDKRKAVIDLLKIQSEWPAEKRWSDRRIGRHLTVSGPFVASLRTAEGANVCTPSAERLMSDEYHTPSTDFGPYQFDAGANDEPAPRKVIQSAYGDDPTGYPIPQSLRDAMQDAECDSIARDLRAIATRVKSAGNWNPHVPIVHTDLQMIAERIEGSRPYAVCRACGGKGCADCMTKGFHPMWERHELAVEYGQQPAA